MLLEKSRKFIIKSSAAHEHILSILDDMRPNLSREQIISFFLWGHKNSNENSTKIFSFALNVPNGSSHRSHFLFLHPKSSHFGSSSQHGENSFGFFFQGFFVVGSESRKKQKELRIHWNGREKNNKFYFYDCKFMPYVAAWRWKFRIFNVFSFHKHGYFFHFFKVFRLTLKPRSWISWITWSFTFCAYHISYPHPSKVVFRLAAPETSLTSVSSTLFTYNFARV